jgi:Ca2+-binding RTX toxin-like protein
MLAVGGSDESDQIRVRRARGGGLNVAIDGIDLGTFHPTGHVEVWGGPGNEDVRLGPQVRQPAWLIAGNGPDLLIGGAGDDVLIAGAGRDLLFGRAGRNVLVVGHRRDRLFARKGRDLLVRNAGLASNPTALASVAAHWSSTRHHRSTRLLHEHASSGRSFAHRPTR